MADGDRKSSRWKTILGIILLLLIIGIV
ncbi:hypothetical protein NEAUS06_2240, partial [Nematocida ausubeli]